MTMKASLCMIFLVTVTVSLALLGESDAVYMEMHSNKVKRNFDNLN